MKNQTALDANPLSQHDHLQTTHQVSAGFRMRMFGMSVNAVMYFGAMYGHFRRAAESEPHAVSVNFKHDDFNPISDDYLFVRFAGKNEHVTLSLVKRLHPFEIPCGRTSVLIGEWLGLLTISRPAFGRGFLRRNGSNYASAGTMAKSGDQPTHVERIPGSAIGKLLMYKKQCVREQ